jgi:tetratricopeptide (TPR) repeat protein
MMNHRPWVLITICIPLSVIFPPSTVSATVPEFVSASARELSGDHLGAVHDYESFIARAPADRLAPVAAMAIATIQISGAADSTAGVHWLDRVLADYRTSPEAPRAARQKGEIAEARRQWTDAAESYAEALALGGSVGSAAWVNEVAGAGARCHERAGQPMKALETYRKLLDGDPPPEVAANAHYRIGVVEEAAGDSTAAAESYAKVLVDFPCTPSADPVLAKRPLIDRHVSIDWKPLELYAAGTRMVGQRDWDGALKSCEELLAGPEDSPLHECAEYRKITIQTLLSGDYTEGTRRMRAFLSDHAGGQRTEMAETTIAQRWAPAVALEARVREHPDDPEALRALGFYMLQIRSGVKALEMMEKARAIDPDNPETQLGLGYAYSMHGRSEEAARAFDAYLKANPDDIDSLNMIGYSYLAMGQAERAIPYFERYASAATEDPNAHDSLGEGYFRAGRLADAAREYEKAVALNPTFSNSFFMLGQVYQQLGEGAKAAAAYRRFLDLSPDGPQADEARAALPTLTAE